MNALDRFVDWLRQNEHRDKAGALPPGSTYQYHPRSNRPPRRLAAFIVDDLLDNCEMLRAHAALGQIACSIDQEFTWPNGKKKKLDLAFGIPRNSPGPPTSGRVHKLPAKTLERLLIACEEKTVMTEHGKSQPRSFSELNDSHAIVHRGNRDTIAAGMTAVNIAATFISPLRQKPGQILEITRHDQPRVTENMVRHLRGLPIRATMSQSGFDAYCTFVIDLDNQGNVTLHTASPAPQPGDPDHYDSFLRRICRLYTERYGNLSRLPEAGGLSMEEALTNLACQYPGLLTTAGQLAMDRGLSGAAELQAILRALEHDVNPPKELDQT